MEFEITAITLLIFLIAKQLAGAMRSERADRIAKGLTIPLVPLMVAFLITLALRSIELAS